MVKYVFTPSAKAFPGSKIMRTIDVTMEGEWFHVNGKKLSDATMRHAVAFAIKQRLANSFASAGTAKNDDGGLLPQAEREAIWQSSFDKVLGKLIDPNAAPDWQSVYTEGGRESADPFEVECNRIAVAGLRAWHKAKLAKDSSFKALPKAASDEFRAMVAKYRAAKSADIEAEAKRRLAEVEAIDIAEDDVDFTDLSA